MWQTVLFFWLIICNSLSAYLYTINKSFDSNNRVQSDIHPPMHNDTDVIGHASCPRIYVSFILCFMINGRANENENTF